MDIRTLQSTVIDALEDLKAHDVKAFSTTGLTDLFDRVIIATGTSNRHTKALAASVRDKVKLKGGAIVSVEGGESGEWVLVDLGDVVVHIMQPAIRNYYNLEELWGSKPVHLKAATTRSPLGSSAAAPTRKSAKSSKARPSSNRTSRTGASGQTSSTSTVRKTTARKSPAGKTPTRRVVAKKTPGS